MQIKPDRSVDFPAMDFRTDLKTQFITERDVEVMKIAAENKVAIVCLSCVESGQDVQEARQILNSVRGQHVSIYSKI